MGKKEIYDIEFFGLAFVLYDQWYTSVDIVLNILMHTYMYVVLIPT
jgi:hypothetical protein